MNELEENNMCNLNEMNLFEGEINQEDLFDGISYDNIEIIVDLDDKVIPIEPNLNFEDLHCSEHDKYCVPIYAGEKGSIFRGSGVIVGNYLITAAHVAQTAPDEFGRKNNYSTLYYRFEGKMIKIEDSQLVHDGRGYHLHCENYDDVIIYQLNGITSSFVLYNGRPEISLKLAAFLYNRKNCDSDVVIDNKHICKVTSTEVKYEQRCIHWKNCFHITENKGNSFIVSGNSGGPVLRDGVVYGILTRDNVVGTVGTVIDSQYIQKCIDEGEKSRNESIHN